MNAYEKSSLCLLHTLKGVGSKGLRKIKEKFGSFSGCLQAGNADLLAHFSDARVAEEIRRLREEVSLQDYWGKLSGQGIDVVTSDETDYPEQLRFISAPPYVLYYRGDLRVTGGFCLAIVGSRRATAYGIGIARKLAGELAPLACVVSGMARGIDTAAHLGVLDAGGHTVAVLGSGVDVIYPRENRKLYQKISEQGVVLSEFPLQTPPDAGNFPVRNRIIAGLSRGVIIVEAQEKSGALITADLALEQGKDIFAVPGPINSEYSRGTNNLIKQGAKLVSEVEDVLDEYIPRNTIPDARKHAIALDKNDNLIIQCMGHEPLHFDELIGLTAIDVGNLSASLIKLELEGLIQSLPGNYYLKTCYTMID